MPHIDKEKHSFITMIKDFGVTKSIMIFKINSELLKNYQKLEKIDAMIALHE